MSGKPKNNKAPKAKKPVEEEVPLEAEEDLFIEETETVEKSPKAKESKDAPEAKKKKKNGFKLSSIDPIILASFAVFLAACLIVTGVTVYGIVAGGSDDAKAEYGSKIVVDYTGSYFKHYDQPGAVIFDTSYSSIGNDENYKKSFEWPKDKTYQSLTFTIGGGQMLADFENAFIGCKPGDTVRIMIEDGYGTLDETNRFVVAKTDASVTTVPANETMTSSDYLAFFGVTELPGVGITTVKSPYGWDAQVSTTSAGMVSVHYIPELNKAYTVCDGLEATATAADTSITFSYNVTGGNFDENANMLKAVVDGQIVYIIGYDGTNFTYKTTDEKTGIDLYFVATFVEYSTS